MRSLVIILLLLLAVACDAGVGDRDHVRESDPTALVEQSHTVDDARPEPTVAATGASATVTAWAATDDGVIDGFCPADPGRYVFRSTKVHAKPVNGWELSGTSKPGRIVLEWGEPAVSGVTGYVVTRHSGAPDLSVARGWTRVVEGSVRTFVVNAGSGGGDWVDMMGIEPCTNYRYRVFPITPDGLGFPVGPLDFWSPSSERLAPRRSWVASVKDLEVWPTGRGATLTWDLLERPTREGIVVQSSTKEHDVINFSEPMAVLPPDITAYTVLTRGFNPAPHLWYCYGVGAFNDYGVQTLPVQRACISGADMVHCSMTTEDVSQEFGPHLMIRFHGCEEANTEVVRRELTADGFEVSKVNEPCTWGPNEFYSRGGYNYHEGILKCEYDDTDVKPGTWYVYELTQTLKDGRTFTSHHEVLTHPRAEVP